MRRTARHEWSLLHAWNTVSLRKSPRTRRRSVAPLHRRLRVEALEDRRLLAVTLGFTGPYAVSNWISTGIAGGTTTLEPAGGDSPTGTFGYDVTLPPGTGVSPRTADFLLASSSVTGLVTFDYTYTGNHRFFLATAGLSTLLAGGATPLVNNSPTSGDFNFSGSATMIAKAGQSFGFRIGGKNVDVDSNIDGTLTITNFVAYDSLIVDSNLDGDDGDYSAGNFTLREAINVANSAPDADKIMFAPALSGKSILLTGGELGITESLTIDATALAAPVTIDAQQQSRVLNFTATTGDLTLSGLTLQNGLLTAVGSQGGAGVNFESSGTLTLTASTVIANTARNSGGGIRAELGAVTLNQSVVSGNSTTNISAAGGGIYSESGAVTLNQSTLSGNSTLGNDSQGGGIYSWSGSVTLNQSTLSGNSTLGVQADGGGIRAGTGAVTLNQSTLSGNSTAGHNAEGGGIASYSGGVTLNHSTLTGNKTTGTGSEGGGIVIGNSIFNPPLTISNSIVAGNKVAAGVTDPDLQYNSQGAIAVNYSVIGIGITPTAGDNNIVTNALLLGPLVNNGGPTQTHALPPGSAAIDAGDPTGGAVHIYEINGSLADELGGPSLVIGVGTLTSEGYEFPAGSGANLNNAIAADEYTIELLFSFDVLGGYQKIIDFHNLADDEGLYSSGTNLEFFSVALAENVLTANTPTHLVVTRDGPTDVVAVYLNGRQVMRFVNSGDIAVFNGLANVIRLFSDDNTTGGGEAASGFLDRIRIYDRDLSAGEVAALVVDQRGAPFVRVFDGDGMDVARIDIGAFEAQPNPLTGDYNFNGIVDAADYTVWRNTLGATNDLRADGDGDGTVDEDDYGVWKLHFGETIEQGAGSGGSGVETVSALAEPVAQVAAMDKEMGRLGDKESSNPVVALHFDTAAIAGGSAFAHNGSAGTSPSRIRAAEFHRESTRDDALVAWLAAPADAGGDRASLGE